METRNHAPEPLIGVRDIAKALGISYRTVESADFTTKLGIPRIKIGGAVRFRPEDVRAAIARLAGEHTPSAGLDALIESRE